MELLPPSRPKAGGVLSKQSAPRSQLVVSRGVIDDRNRELDPFKFIVTV